MLYHTIIIVKCVAIRAHLSLDDVMDPTQHSTSNHLDDRTPYAMQLYSLYFLIALLGKYCSGTRDIAINRRLTTHLHHALARSLLHAPDHYYNRCYFVLYVYGPFVSWTHILNRVSVIVVHRAAEAGSKTEETETKRWGLMKIIASVYRLLFRLICLSKLI